MRRRTAAFIQILSTGFSKEYLRQENVRSRSLVCEETQRLQLRWRGPERRVLETTSLDRIRSYYPGLKRDTNSRQLRTGRPAHSRDAATATGCRRFRLLDFT